MREMWVIAKRELLERVRSKWFIVMTVLWPFLMIGMIAFIVDVPARITDAATVLPVQIFLWSDLPEVGFKAKTAAAIIVLLLFLFVMNGLAIWLRKRFERRW